MTFQDAIDFKGKLGTDRKTQNDLTMKVLITPADHDDFARYDTDYRVGHFTEETSREYGLYGQFKVRGLYNR